MRSCPAVLGAHCKSEKLLLHTHSCRAHVQETRLFNPVSIRSHALSIRHSYIFDIARKGSHNTRILSLPHHPRPPLSLRCFTTISHHRRTADICVYLILFSPTRRWSQTEQNRLKSIERKVVITIVEETLTEKQHLHDPDLPSKPSACPSLHPKRARTLCSVDKLLQEAVCCTQESTHPAEYTLSNPRPTHTNKRERGSRGQELRKPPAQRLKGEPNGGVLETTAVFIETGSCDQTNGTNHHTIRAYDSSLTRGSPRRSETGIGFL